eukprot:12615607-Alexandrium_andersonii.AAC.2
MAKLRALRTNSIPHAQNAAWFNRLVSLGVDEAAGSDQKVSADFDFDFDPCSVIRRFGRTPRPRGILGSSGSVSYTHLTLPTIC